MRNPGWLTFAFAVASYSQTVPAFRSNVEPSATFTTAQLRRDFQVLREALEEGHPGIYRFTPKSELDHVFDRAAKQLNRPMTAMDFYRLLAPVVARLKCGHTFLRPSGLMEQRLADEPLIPIEIAILGGKLYVARDYSAAAQLAGAEVLSDRRTRRVRERCSPGQVLDSACA